jgi:apolipoprotein N-acyltransferase
VIALFNTALAARREKVLKSLVIAGVVAALIHIGGQWSMDRKIPQQDKIAVAVIQTSLDEDQLSPQQSINRTIRAYTQLTGEAANYQPNIIVWPEASLPGDIIANPNAHKWVMDIARASGAHLLAGGTHYVPAKGSNPGTSMNAAYMLSPDGSLLGSYYKVRLAPFGEYVPGRKWLPFITRYCIRKVDLQRGTKHNLLPTAFGKAGVVICFESVFPVIARKETSAGADFLCVMTREVLFKKTALALQHHDLAVFRAVENRRFVVRAATSGVSSVIDPYGRVQDKLGMWERGVLYSEIEARKSLTFYTRFGDWFAYLSCLIATIGVGSGVATWRRKKAGNSKGRSEDRGMSKDVPLLRTAQRSKLPKQNRT